MDRTIPGKDFRSQPLDAPLPGAWRTVTILTLLYWFGTLDRQVAALLIPDIKKDLTLSDFEVSLIQGLGFGLLYMLMSPFMGWLVDRISRRFILFGCTIGWSLSAMCSGLARGFGGLFAARAGVGGFEAALNPTSYAMLGDLFPPKKLALPMSVYVLGGNLGSGMSFLVGGAVIAWIMSNPEHVLPFVGPLSGWQMAFVVTGAPGLLLAPLIWLARDPRMARKEPMVQTGFGDLWRHITQHKAFYLLHHIGFGLIMSLIVGLQSWNSAYLSRHFGWDLATIGYTLGATQLGSALLGLVFHGWAVDKMFARGRTDAHLVYFMAMALLAAPALMIAYTASSAMVMVVAYNIAYFLVMSFASVGPAALQIATPAPLRGKASSVYMVFLTVIGTMLGPVFVALITDFVFADEASLGLSMAIFGTACALLAAASFHFGRVPMRRAVASAINPPA
ncbi:MAG: MFS transporter [Novosphingobium sp.]